MTIQKNFYLTAIAALFGAALATSAMAQSGERIAVFTKNQTNPFFQVVRLGADSAAKQMGAVVTHYVPTKPDSIPEQLSQVDDVIIHAGGLQGHGRGRAQDERGGHSSGQRDGPLRGRQVRRLCGRERL